MLPEFFRISVECVETSGMYINNSCHIYYGPGTGVRAVSSNSHHKRLGQILRLSPKLQMRKRRLGRFSNLPSWVAELGFEPRNFSHGVGTCDQLVLLPSLRSFPPLFFTCFFCYPPGMPIDGGYFVIVPQVSEALFIFFFNSILFLLLRLISVFLSPSSLSCSSLISILLLSPWTEVFISVFFCIFSLYFLY